MLFDRTPHQLKLLLINSIRIVHPQALCCVDVADLMYRIFTLLPVFRQPKFDGQWDYARSSLRISSAQSWPLQFKIVSSSFSHAQCMPSETTRRFARY